MKEDDLPTVREWDCLELIMRVLDPFKIAQKQLEGQKYVTSSLVCRYIHNCRRKLQRSKKSRTRLVQSQATKMLTDFDNW